VCMRSGTGTSFDFLSKNPIITTPQVEIKPVTYR
jgi:hypothetical protein